MKLKYGSLALVGALAVVLLGHVVRAAAQAGTGNEISGRPKALENRVAALESSIDKIMRTLSGQSRPTDVSSQKVIAQAIPQSRATAEAELTEKRLEAVEKSLGNIASYLATKNEKPGSKCRWVRECVYITCCKWGAPPSDPGTVKCMEQCCGTWENRLVCD